MQILRRYDDDGGSVRHASILLTFRDVRSQVCEASLDASVDVGVRPVARQNVVSCNTSFMFSTATIKPSTWTVPKASYSSSR